VSILGIWSRLGTLEEDGRGRTGAWYDREYICVGVSMGKTTSHIVIDKFIHLLEETFRFCKEGRLALLMVRMWVAMVVVVVE
jgi:hypothetical protein